MWSICLSYNECTHVVCDLFVVNNVICDLLSICFEQCEMWSICWGKCDMWSICCEQCDMWSICLNYNECTKSLWKINSNNAYITFALTLKKKWPFFTNLCWNENPKLIVLHLKVTNLFRFRIKIRLKFQNE